MRIVNAGTSWVTPEFIIDESYKLIEAPRVLATAVKSKLWKVARKILPVR